MTDKARSTRDQFYADLFTTALEGGINYWCRVHKYHIWRTPETTATSETFFEERSFDFEGYYADVRPSDSDDPQDVMLRIDRATIVRGWNHLLTLPDHWMAKEARKYRNRLDEIDYDAEWADVVVQLGLFGEVVYG